MGKDFIYDQDTGKSIAFIQNGEVFRNDREEAKIGTVRSGSICDLEGNLVVPLDGDLVTGLRTGLLPASFRKLLNAENSGRGSREA